MYTPHNIKKLLYSFSFIIFVFLGLEGISRIAFYIWPLEVHQKYLIKKSGEDILRAHNGRGARGSIYLGQPIKIAIFGSSITELHYIKQNLTWSEQLKKYLGNDIHIDVFAVGTGDKTVEDIMRTLIAQDYHYDIILLQLVLSHAELYLSKARLYEQHYSGRFLAPDHIKSHFVWYLKKWWEQKKSDDIFEVKWSPINFLSSPQTKKISKVIKAPKTISYSKDIRQSQIVKSRLVDLPQSWVDEIHERWLFHKNKADEILSAAHRLGDYVLWGPDGIAYDKDMLESYKDIYITTLPCNNDQNYVNEKGLAKFTKEREKITRQLFRQRIDGEINWSSFIQKKLSHEPGLYSDEYHLSEKGSLLVGKHMADQLRPFINEIRTHNK